MAAGLAACGTDTSILDANAGIAPPSNLRPASTKAIIRTVAYKPALGPPDETGNELTRQLNDAAIEQGIALVIDPAIKSDLTLRGYVSAFRKGNTINVTYLWDVVDARGQRVNRIAGEEALTNGIDVAQPWGAVTPAVSRLIAQKTVAELTRWVKSNPLPGSPTNVSASPAARPSGAGAAALSSPAPTAQ